MSAATALSNLAHAQALDAADPLRAHRSLFHIPPSPKDPSGKTPSIYMTGNSLGCQPKSTRALVEQELEDWARLGVAAHLHGRDPWLPYHEWFAEPAARLVGGRAGARECVMMNSLTANLHLLMVSFYRPTRDRGGRFEIIIEDSAFPSDSYAVASQVRHHGIDPSRGVVRLKPRRGEHTLRTSDIEGVLEERKDSAALLLLGAVNYLTGQWFEMERLTAVAKQRGITVGWDLAHAAGNVPLQLHDWGVDFAAWCTYKYLNSGPGAVAGAFVHERHFGGMGSPEVGSPPLRGGSSLVTRFTEDDLGATGDPGQDRLGAAGHPLPRFAGWWGNDPATRFKMGPDFVPRQSADGWQLSNPPIMALAPVKASMQIFDQVGMPALREKSVKLTAYLESLIRAELPNKVEIITPREPEQRGAQLSLLVQGATRDLEQRLHGEGVVIDFREPNIIRVAPTPLYNTFADCHGLVAALKGVLG